VECQTKEIWRDVVGGEGLYLVSNHGKVKSLNYNKTGKTQLMKLTKNRGGYLKLELYIDKKAKSYLIHRLVAESFLKNPLDLPCINHIDENKTNNNINNLEYCTMKYNNLYGTRPSRTSKANSIPIIGVNILTNENISFDSASHASKYDFDISAICKCCRGELKQHKGYEWHYEEDCYENNNK
jgi:hypothetical protein